MDKDNKKANFLLDILDEGEESDKENSDNNSDGENKINALIARKKGCASKPKIPVVSKSKATVVKTTQDTS